MNLMELFFVVTVFILFLWIIYRWNARAFVKLAYEVPSNKWHTFFACGSLLIGKDVLSGMHEHGKKHNPTSVYWIGPFSFFLTSEPKLLKDILMSKKCINKPLELYNGFVSIAGQGIITESEPVWSQHRKLLNRGFTLKNLISYFNIYHEEVNSLIHKIQRSIDREENIDLLVLFRELTIKNGTKFLLKRDLDLTEFNSRTMSKHLHGILEYIAEISFNQILTIKWIRKLAEIFIYRDSIEGFNTFLKLVSQSLNILQSDNTKDPSTMFNINSVLDITLKGVDQNLIKVNEIPGQILHIFAGAIETTSSTLFFVLTLLAMHPEYQERAHEEISNIIPHDDTSTNISLEQLDQLIYLEMLINETMRILPVVPMVFRKVTDDNLKLSNDLILPIGQYICIDILRLHRNKDLWGPEADIFNPDNFLPENIAARDPYSFIPFTKGLRFCIGWKYFLIFAKISLAKLIKTYKFTTDLKYEDLILENYMTLKLVNRPQIQLERR